MNYKLHSHRYGLEIIEKEEDFKQDWKDIIEIIESISDEEIIEHYEAHGASRMSISTTINNLLKEKFVVKGWAAESAIFSENAMEVESEYRDKRWRLDFANKNISIEVAFNHGEAIAWNLLKPVLASELNHVEKAFQTKIGIVITATDEMKKAGAFDGAVGSFEKYLRYLKPLNNQLTVPMVIIGLEKPDSFIVEKRKVDKTNIGFVKRI
ncbi:BglII/BstYI family type II restriction endonuclease [Aliarcobacter butzleri]|uniref:BglII/BstYI family type II restriction endonuclease n=1 Tax=Aliarcobacter butzleri TaxID=28197 RepID=UPI0021B3ACE5|nr:BglII/BstYI family type II restriction endonuclease [Aliarcobacter butzleri]MCT7618540.1 hypothetical protein [Aliarcobacter butzleri]